VTAQWPRLRLRSRVTPSDLTAATPHFVADRAPAPPSYAISPSALALLLEIVAALAAAAAVLLIVCRPRAVAQPDELARALRLVRESETRPVPDRRRALGLLARVAPSPAARELAWSRPEPEPEAIETVAGEVERR
jgi:hypothetical protein